MVVRTSHTGHDAAWERARQRTIGALESAHESSKRGGERFPGKVDVCEADRSQRMYGSIGNFWKMHVPGRDGAGEEETEMENKKGTNPNRRVSE